MQQLSLTGRSASLRCAVLLFISIPHDTIVVWCGGEKSAKLGCSILCCCAIVCCCAELRCGMIVDGELFHMCLHHSALSFVLAASFMALLRSTQKAGIMEWCLL